MRHSSKQREQQYQSIKKGARYFQGAKRGESSCKVGRDEARGVSTKQIPQNLQITLKMLTLLRKHGVSKSMFHIKILDYNLFFRLVG